MLSIAHSRYRALRGAIRSGGIAPSAPPPSSGSMLVTGGPDRLFDSAEMRANPNKITEWNNFVYANSGPGGAGDTMVLPNGTVIRHKNNGVKALIARNVTTGGFMRFPYPKEGQVHKDPTDATAPNDPQRYPDHVNPSAPDYIDAAHRGPHFCNPDGSFYLVNYGEEIEFAVRFRIPIPSDCSEAGWNDLKWFLLCQMPTTKTVTSEGIRITTTFDYDPLNKNKLQIFSSKSTSAAKTMNPPLTPGEGITPAFNTWYELRVLCCLDNTTGKRGWFRSWRDGSAYINRDGMQSGNSGGGSMYFSPLYHDYNPNGLVGVHIDRLEIRKTGRSGTGTSFPVAP